MAPRQPAAGRVEAVTGRISGKLFVIPLVGIAFMTLLALVAYLGLRAQRSALVDMYEARYGASEHASRLVNDLTNVHARIYKLLSWTTAGYDPKRVDDLAKDLDETLRQRTASVRDALGSQPLQADERRLYETSLQELEEYVKTAHGVIELATADIGMANTYMSIAEDRFDVLGTTLESLLSLEDRLSRENYEHSLARFRLALGAFLTLYGAALVLSILGSVFILQRMVISPIRSIEAAAQRIAEGDLTFDVASRGGDEIGRMVHLLRISFQGLCEILRRITDLSGRISSVVESVEQESQRVVAGASVESGAIVSISEAVRALDAMAASIAENTRSLASSTGETRTSIEHLVRSIGRIDDNVAELSQAAGSTSSSIAELAQSVDEVAANAERLAAASEETLTAVSDITRAIVAVERTAKESAAVSHKVTNDAATLGLASVDRTVDGMKKIEAAVEHTGEFVGELGRRSAEIGKILDVVKGVTDQTELLSLNASILAAQAGEHGRGFAVVANEIKALAGRTRGSTQEISSFISKVQQDVNNVAGALANGLFAVKDGLAIAAGAGAALREIVESSRQSSSMALSIELSTVEQGAAALRASQAMERVRDMTTHIARATAEQARSAVSIRDAGEQIASAARDVGRASAEQAAASEQVSRTVQDIFVRSTQISESLSEHELGSKRILASVEQVKSIPAQNRSLASAISVALAGLQKDSELLDAELKRFRLGADRVPEDRESAAAEAQPTWRASSPVSR